MSAARYHTFGGVGCERSAPMVWMGRMAVVEHATKPKDEVNADLLVTAAGT
jgi:hypothetical protein